MTEVSVTWNFQKCRTAGTQHRTVPTDYKHCIQGVTLWLCLSQAYQAWLTVDNLFPVRTHEYRPNNESSSMNALSVSALWITCTAERLTTEQTLVTLLRHWPVHEKNHITAAEFVYPSWAVVSAAMLSFCPAHITYNLLLYYCPHDAMLARSLLSFGCLDVCP